MPTPQAEVSAIVNHFLALVREHGVVAELDGELSMLLTAKPFLIIHGIEPEKKPGHVAPQPPGIPRCLEFAKRF